MGNELSWEWIKDRKDRILDFERIIHYQPIINALTETDRVMGEIDCVAFIKRSEG